MAFGFVSRLLVISASPDHACTNEPSFLQGDKEAELGLPFSPLCDRKSTMVAQSQIGNAEDRVTGSWACACRFSDGHTTLSKGATSMKTSFHSHDSSFLRPKYWCWIIGNIKTFSQNEFNEAVLANYVIVILLVMLLQKGGNFNLGEETAFFVIFGWLLVSVI